MELIDYVDGNFQIAFVLFLVLQYTNKVFTTGGVSIKAMNRLSVCAIIASVCEGIMQYYFSEPQVVSQELKIGIGFIVCVRALAALATATCWPYFVYFLLRYERSKPKDLITMGIPFFIGVLIIVTTPITNFMYTLDYNLDGTIVYGKGPLYLCIVAIEMGYLIYTSFLVYINRTKIKLRQLIVLMACIIVPFTGTMVQIVVPEWLLIFQTSILIAIVTYLVLQEYLVKNDFNTGTIKKTVFNSYIRQTLKAEDNGYGIAYVTLKDYVKVRDKHGKLAQEQYISDFGKLLIDLADERAKIVYAQSGDYIIYVNTQKEYEIEEIIEKIARLTQEYNLNVTDDSKQKIEFIFAIEMFKEKYKDNFGLISAAAEKIDIMQQEAVVRI